MKQHSIEQNGLALQASGEDNKFEALLTKWGAQPRALFQFGSIVTGARNSVAGMTYSQNKGGSYIKAKPIPTNPRSVAQRNVRAQFALNAKQWSQLTDAQRAAWTFFAQNNPYNNVFGQSKQLSGMAMMMSLNQVLALIGSAFEPDAPADLSVPVLASPLTLSVTSAGGTISAMGVTTDVQSLEPGALYYLFSTPPLAAGKTAGVSDYRFIGTSPSTAAAVSFGTLALYSAVFGTNAAAGQHIACLVSSVNVNTGAVTVAQQFDSGPLG